MNGLRGRQNWSTLYCFNVVVTNDNFQQQKKKGGGNLARIHYLGIGISHIRIRQI